MKRKILYALLALVFSFSLWAYVITTENPEHEATIYNIPVILDGEVLLNERGLMVTSQEIPKVNLKLSGSRSDLSKLDNTRITLVADVSSIDSPGEKKLSYSISFPGDVPNNAFSVVEQSPGAISMTFAQRKSEKVPVQIHYDGAVPDQYIFDRQSVEQDYKEINVTGSADVIDRIDHAHVNVSLNGQTSSISQSYSYILCDKDHNPVDASQLKTDVSEVKLKLRIQRWKEIPVNFRLLYGGGTTKDTAFAKWEPLTIRVSGSDQLLANLNQIDLGVINFAEYLENTEFKIPIDLPEGVTNLTGPSEATVNISFEDLETKVLRVTNIVPLNVPAGIKVNINTTEVNVRVRGPKDQVALLTEDMLSVRVDFSGAKLAVMEPFQATVYVSSEYSEVGVVGTYTVWATLTQAEAGEP